MKERNINRVWIGVYRGTGTVNNTFFTVRDVQVSYTNWSDGEPNNYGNSHENCVELKYDGNIGWNDIICNVFDRYFICEQNL
jgi:hypothetical protein